MPAPVGYKMTEMLPLCLFLVCSSVVSTILVAETLIAKKMSSGQYYLSAIRKTGEIVGGSLLGILIGQTVASHVTFPGTTRGIRFEYDWMHKAANEELKRRNERRTTTNSNAAAAADG